MYEDWHEEPPHLLSDEQMRQFICDGFLIIDPQVPQPVHQAAYQKLQWMLDEEYNPGNNNLPRMPEMQQVLDAPRVRGALASVLGEDYILHPHRFCHSNLPGEMTEDGLAPSAHPPLGRHAHPQCAHLLT